MPKIDLFNADADAGFDEGWSEGSASAQANITGLVEAQFCHGIDLGIDITAAATANAHLRLLVLGANANIGVNAHAGVRGQITFEPNIFQQFGLTARIEAAAEIAATARLEIALESEYVAVLASRELDGLALELFLAFLREASIGGGVYGKVAFSAMAKAWAQIAGKMGDDKSSGFTIGGGYAVGLKGGYGMDWYAKIGFENPRRFFTTSVNLIVDELVDELQNELPAGNEVAIELFRLLVPMGLKAAYDVGQKSITQGISSPNELIQPFLTAFAESLQQYLVDKAIEHAATLLSSLIEEALVRLAGRQVTAQEKSTVEASVGRLQDALQDGKLDPEDIDELIHLATTIIEISTPELLPRLKVPASMLWSAVVAGIALRDVGEALASGNISVLGLGAQASVRIHSMPEISSMPNIVLQEYMQNVNDFDGSILSFDHTMDYLIAIGIGPILSEQAPEMSVLLARLHQATGISPGNIVTFGIQGAIGGSIGETELYQALRDFVRNAVNDVIHLYIFAPYDQLSSNNSDAKLYMDEVAKPSVNLMTFFLFEQLDRAIAQPSLLGGAEFLSTLQTGLSSLLYKIVARNLVVIEQIASNTVREQTVTAMAQLEQTVKDDRTNVLMVTTVEHLDDVLASISQYVPLLPTSTGLSNTQLDALQTFVAEMLNISQEALGNSVFTDARWNKRRQAMLALMLSLDTHFDWSAEDRLQEFIDTMKQCAFVPDEQAIQDLFDVHIELLLEQAEILLRRLPRPLGELILALTGSQFEQLARAAELFADEAEEALNAARQTLENIIHSLEAIIELAQQALDELNRQIENATASILLLNSSLLKDALIDVGRSNIHSAVTAQSPDFSNAVLEPIISGFSISLNLVYGLISPIIDSALNGIRMTHTFRNIIEQSISNISDSEWLAANSSDTLVSDITDNIFNAIDQEILTLLPVDNTSVLFINVNIPLLGEVNALDPGSIARVISTKIIALLNLDDIVSALINSAIYAAQQRKLEAQKPDNEINVTIKTNEHEAIRSRDGAKISILSPVSLGDKADKFYAHGPIVPLSLIINHTGSGWGRNNNGGRIQITANGKQLLFPASAWQYNERRAALSLSTMLRLDGANIQAGLNIIEISVALGENNFLRETIEFLVDPDAVVTNSLFSINADASQFNSPGNDHLSVDEEYVALHYTGDTTVDMTGWRLRDKAGHEYLFEKFTIKPGQQVQIHTGGTPQNNTKKRLFWGRKKAVWNNTGDTVILLNKTGTVQAQHIY